MSVFDRLFGSTAVADEEAFPWEPPSREPRTAVQMATLMATVDTHTEYELNLIGDWPHGLRIGDVDASILLWFEDPAAVDRMLHQLKRLKAQAAR